MANSVDTDKIAQGLHCLFTVCNRSYLESAIFETCKISTFINMSFEST